MITFAQDIVHFTPVQFIKKVWLGVLALLCVQIASAGNDVLYRYNLTDYSEASYADALDVLVRKHEEAGGQSLVPGAKGKVVLKLSTRAGPGLCTSPALVKALIALLEARGFERDNIYLVDQHARDLADCGYLRSPAQRDGQFAGCPVVALDWGQYWNLDWFYESPLPPRQALVNQPESVVRGVRFVDSRRSYLPTLLLFDVDFWVNIPVAFTQRSLEIYGAIANAGVGLVSNEERFLGSASVGPIGAAEIAAVPELRKGCALTLLSFENFQYVGAGQYNAFYTQQKPSLLLGEDLVRLDAFALEWINIGRKENGFRPLEQDPAILEYAQQVGLGKLP